MGRRVNEGEISAECGRNGRDQLLRLLDEITSVCLPVDGDLADLNGFFPRGGDVCDGAAALQGVLIAVEDVDQFVGGSGHRGAVGFERAVAERTLRDGSLEEPEDVLLCALGVASFQRLREPHGIRLLQG